MMSIEISAIRTIGRDVETCNDQPQLAEGFAVYIRNPLAFHVQDFDIPHDRRGPFMLGRIARAASRRRAFDYAAALAEHLGCTVETQLLPPRALIIQPERDRFRCMAEGADGSTCFEACEEADAELWAVYDTRNGSELVDDFQHRVDAEIFVDRDGRSPAGDPIWQREAA